MKTKIGYILIIILGFSACNPHMANQAPAQTPTALPPRQVTPTGTRVGLSPAQQAAISRLSGSLALPAEQITLVSTEAVIWPNGCLGIQLMGVLCTRNEIPGFRIVLAANGRQFEFHTNEDGTSILPAQGMLVPSTVDELVAKQLAINLGLTANDIKVVSSSPVEWRDGCLGIAFEGTACAQMITPGYLIVLEASLRQYEYHTNQDASLILPSTLALDWRKEGGLAGFCERVTAYASGEVYALDCKMQAGEKKDTLIHLFSAAERQQFYSLLDRYGTVSVDLSDPTGVSDGMTRRVDLYGSGTAQAGVEDQQALYHWGELIFQKLNQ
jgi:hypothetical protein